MKAFPHTYDQIIKGHVATCTNYGMDLRDWFAGYAMQALVNAQGEDFSADFIAEAAYEMANEMMKVREQ
jgi:hypothetical protein